MKYFGIIDKCFNCKERLEIFLTCFCNILCNVGKIDVNVRSQPL